MLSWKELIKRGIIIVILSFVLYALVTLSYIVLSSVRLSSSLFKPAEFTQASTPQSAFAIGWTDNDWRNRLAAPPAPLTRTLTISVSVVSTNLDMELWITPTHEISIDIQNGALESLPSRAAFIQAAFGRIRIDGLELAEADYGPPHWTIDDGMMHVMLGASRKLEPIATNRVEIDRSRFSLVTPLNDQISVRLDGMRLTSSTIQPQSSSETWAVFSPPVSREPISLSFEPLLARDSGTMPSVDQAQETRQNFLRRLGDIIDIPLVSTLVFSVVEALPLLIFLYLLNRRKEVIPPFAWYLGGTVVGLLLFHFIQYYLAGSSNLMYGASVFQDIAKALANTIPTEFVVRSYDVLNAPIRIAPVILGIVVPMLLLQRSGYLNLQRESTFRFWLIPVAVMVLVVLSLGIFFVEIQGNVLEDVPLIAWVGLITLTIVCLMWLTLYMLYRQLSDYPPQPVLLWLATFVLPLVATLNYMDSSWREPIELLSSVLLGLLLLLALFNVIRQLVLQTSVAFHVPRLFQLGLVLLAILLVVPMASIVGYSSSWSSITDLLNLAYRLDDWIPFVWLGGLLWLLYTAGKAGQQIDPFTRSIGILGASMLFFDPLSRWFYVPITFLLGWWALNYFVQQPTYWTEELAPMFQRVFEGRLALLDQIIDLNEAEGALQQFRKKLSTMLASPEDKLTFTQYHEQLEARKKELEQLQEKTKIGKKSVRELALTFGPYPSAWENGVHGAKMAVVFAAPWLILYLQDFLTRSTPHSTYLLWGFAHDLLLVVAKWAVFGFFFGYFFPYLRGTNGLQKGLGLFLVAVLPYLPLMVLYTTNAADWQARFFWILQVFIQCMLLGLVAFDYQILRRGNYDWPMLFEVHGMTGVGISVSSILVAVGAAVTTLLTSQATNLVSLALKFILPQAPNIPIPPGN